MTHKMNLQDKYFDFIKNGTKRIELRLNDEKRQQIKIGDSIEFSNEKDKFIAKVIGLLEYQDFKTLFNDFGIEILADKTMTKEELLGVLSEFYTPEKQEKFGVLGIRVEL
ncbi:MAG: ASCH domain-containing protein [Candidatus Nanogingivalaceae bacterium]|nr:ASCH domain-containing protein [Candidatus Nanogingivalaceae bacterium]